MDENEFEIDGTHYIAVDGGNDDCTGCAFARSSACHTAPCCWPSQRIDGRDVIFVERQQ